MESDQACGPRFVLRRLYPADADAVSRLEQACFPSGWSAGAYARALADPAFLAWGAFGEQGGLAGYIACQTAAGELEVLNVAVDPACRGRGTASRLLAEVLHEAREKSIEKCCLEVRPSNAPALRLYLSAGFEQAGLRRRYYSDGEDALVMTLELA